MRLDRVAGEPCLSSHPGHAGLEPIEHLLFRTQSALGPVPAGYARSEALSRGRYLAAGGQGEAITSVLTHLPGSADLDRPAAPIAASFSHLGTLKRKVCQLRAEISISRTYLTASPGTPCLWTVINVGEPLWHHPFVLPTLGIGLGEVGAS